ncbi:heterokaryon incompatibility protein (HET) domain-containing protein [Pochonia chlamydosporia 170]|uniref:Heterokaryon incompatibility protein (HET) domain-containing protein n=1 Tax=Pochonia chlamydosporia 170 TaxID=1380566 RepID=A0A179FNN4_METCM|nr:heterokaryon incompatibility protein (HET) domain-containing protein [Pochonia chlamydosporia 170]OAQ66840.1 heterokaryon incompatibility protein (HET) domain-containing protein [Pochonia chlamydosporia 170]
MLNGQHIRVSATVNEAILRLQSILDQDVQYLWIDQICINQADIQERGHQVSLMAEIYSKADSVYVWLGEDQDGLVGRLEHIISTYVPNGPKAHTCISKSDCADMLKLCAGYVRTDLTRALDEGSQQNSATFAPSDMLVVLELLRRPWFRRAWVVQEVAVAQTATILIGSHAFSLTDIDYLVSLTALAEREADEIPCPGTQFRQSKGFQCFHQMVHQRERYHDPGADGHIFAFLCRVAGLCEATDGRDMVYAFQGIYQRSQSLLIEPDYSLPVEVVFMKLAKALVAESHALDIFAAVNGPGSSSTRHDENFDSMSISSSTDSFTEFSDPRDSQHESTLFPSWTPDWRFPLDHVPLYTGQRSPRFCASGPFAHRTVSDDQMDCLTARGKIIAHIDALHFLAKPRRPGDGILTLQQQLPLDMLLSTLRKQRAKTSPLVTLERILRVIVADGSDRGEFSSKIEASTRRLSDRRISELVLAWEMTAFPIQNENTVERIHEDARVLEQHCRVSHGRWLFSTQGAEALGLAPLRTLRGDVVAIVHGSRTPVVLRQVADSRYCVVGQCYLERAMYGQAVTWEEEQADLFVLV